MARKLTLNTARKPTDATWDPDQVLAEALMERAQFLEQHPHYKTFQASIDRMVDKAGSAEARMAVIAFLMEAKLIDLQGQLRLLNRILIKMAA